MNKEDILSEIYEYGEEIDEFTFRDPVTNTEERYILFDTPWEYAVVQMDYDPTTKKVIKEDVISIAPKYVYSYSEVKEKFETLKKKLQTKSTESADLSGISSGELIDKFVFQHPVANTVEYYLLYETPLGYAVIMRKYDTLKNKLISEQVMRYYSRDIYSEPEVVEKFETLKKKLQTKSTESTESSKESTESAEESIYECHWCGYRIRSRRKPELCPICKWHVFRIIG
jgi:rubrerythrin